MTEIKSSLKTGADELVIGKARFLVNSFVIKRRTTRVPEILFQFIVEKCKEAILQKNNLKGISSYLYRQMKGNPTYGKMTWFIIVNGRGKQGWFINFDQLTNQVWVQFQCLDIVLTYYKISKELKPSSESSETKNAID